MAVRMTPPSGATASSTTSTGTFVGGYNSIYAGSGAATIYGDCQVNYGQFQGGHNTIYGGTGNADIWGG